MAIATGASQPGQNCVFDPRKRTSRTPQPSQNLSSRELTTSEEWRDSPLRSKGFQFDPWLIGSPLCFGIRTSSRSFFPDHQLKRTMQVARHSETAETKEREHQTRSTCFSKMTNREQAFCFCALPLALSGSTTAKYFQARRRGPERSHWSGNQFLKQIMTRC